MKSGKGGGHTILTRVGGAVCLATLLAWTYGCAHSGEIRSNSVEVTITASGTIAVNRSVVDLPDLAAKLKGMGAKPDTSIIISVPGSVPPNTVETVSSHLYSAGFQKVLFQGPKQATATVVPSAK